MSKINDLARELKNAKANYKDYKYEYEENGWTFPSPDPEVASDAVEYWALEVQRLEEEVKNHEYENN